MRKRKGFNPEHSSTFAKAITEINAPEDYVTNPDQIDSIHWYRRLQDSHAPGPSDPLKLYRGKDWVQVFCDYIKKEVRMLYHMFPEKPMEPLTSEEWKGYI